MVESEHGNLAYDSERQYLGTVYAKALMGAAGAGNIESVLEELESVVTDVLTKVPAIEATLSSPRISLEAKESMIDKAFASASSTLKNFLKVVCQHGRFDSIRVIYRSARALHDEEAGRVEVTLTTAEAADDALKSRITEQLSKALGQQVRLKTKVDPAILGGIVVKVGDTVYDGSLSNQLNQVRNAAVDRAMQNIRESLDRFVVDA